MCKNCPKEYNFSLVMKVSHFVMKQKNIIMLKIAMIWTKLNVNTKVIEELRKMKQQLNE